jgi:hypothetical protein
MKSIYNTTAPGAFAYYYCSGRITDINTARNILGSLLRQLARTGRGLAQFQYWQSTHTQSDLTCNCMRNLIQELIEMNEKTLTTIIIDGLDEMDTDELHVLLKALLHLIHKTKTAVKIFLSSRDEQRIEIYLQCWSRIEVLSKFTAKDIKTYIHTVVDERLTYKEGVTDDLRSLIKSTMVARAHGM